MPSNLLKTFELYHNIPWEVIIEDSSIFEKTTEDDELKTNFYSEEQNLVNISKKIDFFINKDKDEIFTKELHLLSLAHASLKSHHNEACQVLLAVLSEKLVKEHFSIFSKSFYNKISDHTKMLDTDFIEKESAEFLKKRR